MLIGFRFDSLFLMFIMWNEKMLRFQSWFCFNLQKQTVQASERKLL